MQELSRLELDSQTVDLLPRREALGCYSSGSTSYSEDNSQNNEQYGLVNVNALNFNHSGIVYYHG